MLDHSNVKSNNETGDRDRGYVSAPPAVSLPKGGGAIAGIGEKFSMNPVTGTGSLSIPIFVSPGRSGFSPQLALSYDSGAGNSAFGLGWSLGVPAVTRKTQKGLPQYRDAEDSDIFLLSGAEDLVPKRTGDNFQNYDVRIVDVPDDVLPQHLSSYAQTGTYKVRRYRPRIEGLFARIERWEHQDTGDVHWRSLTKDNITSVYGKDLSSRVVDPTEPTRIFEWLLCESYDDKGNVIIYHYKQEDAANVDSSLPQEQNRLLDGHSYTQQYLKQVWYGNQQPFARDNWLFQVVFDYGEHDEENPLPDDVKVKPWLHRQDAFSSFRSGFEVRTQRLCQRVLMFHRFDEAGQIDATAKSWYLVRSTDLGYEPDPVATYLITATQTGYSWDETAQEYRQKSYPPLELSYDRPEIQDKIKSIDQKSLENLPVGLDGGQYQWLDLDGEGISGILTEQAGGWFYKANLGEANLAPLQVVATKPSVSNLSDSQQRFMDLAGDGQQDLVLLNRSTPGFYERTLDEEWSSFKAFRTIPNVNWNDPNLRMIDLNGDGHADILISEQEVFVWYPSQAEAGFGQSNRVYKLFEEEKNPTVIFADAEQSVYLADMTGDGLNDIVRIRNGEVCYWANMGYGKFGSKVTMGNAPYFDHPELFDRRRIKLADIDGSGTTDLIYLGREQVHLWFNQAGNSWSKLHQLKSFLPVDNLTSVQMVDLFGNGTACLVWSSPLPGTNHRQMSYIDLMGGQKPHLLRAIKNNLGAETKLHYAASTKFYLADKATGQPWITRIPFPVQVVERVETLDHISGNKFVSSYRYRHGYFDGKEREFRGFGYVEQVDTETFEVFQDDGVTNATDESLHIPPILTKTWFHTGFYRDREHISQLFAEEYYQGDAQAVLLQDTILPDGLSSQEEREACRSLRGQVLRQEVYSVEQNKTELVEHLYTVTESNLVLLMPTKMKMI
ncbi:MAG: SpvB/TcaC N-terminal domain-containing protein [Xenococcaceae cyanobacterium MO_207.B15]|nr:SpvB/TcaC N-terminal domain-containing protein [Xenococcaceae cyanobacterium MO_207.B15]